jgi:cobalt/nickel transport system permease protein
MGIVASLVGYYFYRGATRIIGEDRRGRLVGGFIASWSSVFLDSIACAIEPAVSGTVPLMVALPAMAGFHALIGIGEGLITVAVLSLVLATRRDLLELHKI